MSDFAAPIVPRFLKTPDAAVHLGLSARTLEKHRCYGTGPLYRKLGGRIVYAIDELTAWAEIGRRSSTSDQATATILPARPVQRGLAAHPFLWRRLVVI